VTDGTFSVIRAKRAGRDAIIVVDTALDADRLAVAFPSLVEMTLPIRRPNRFGLCDDVESERLGDVEDRVLGVLRDDEYRYVGRVTWNGSRDILIYVRDPESVVTKLQAEAERIRPAQAVRFEKKLDATWEAYRALV
jgi:hypothetical protein